MKKILESKAKKTLDNLISQVGGEKLTNLVKRSGRNFLAWKQKLKKTSSISDVSRIKTIQPKYLHFGCGDRVIKGWANIDLRLNDDWEKQYLKYFSFEMDKKGNRGDFFQIDFTEEGIPVPNNSVEGIFHEDFIEHINQRDTFVFLAETFRVMKKGAVQRISTPDLKASMGRHSFFSNGKQGVYTNEWNKHGHLNIFTRQYLEEVAKMIGFSEVVFGSRNISRLNPLPRAYRPGSDKLSDDEQIFCDLIK